MKKQTRQKNIVDLIKKNKISTQQELSDKLEEIGIKSTQATISRDIKELNVIKVQDEDGKSYYTIIDKVDAFTPSKIKNILDFAVTSIDESDAGIVVQTAMGLANLCAEYIDSLQLDGVLGTLADRNIVLIILKEASDKEEIIKVLRKSIQ